MLVKTLSLALDLSTAVITVLFSTLVTRATSLYKNSEFLDPLSSASLNPFFNVIHIIFRKIYIL